MSIGFTALALFAAAAASGFPQEAELLRWRLEEVFTVGGDAAGPGFDVISGMSFAADGSLLVLDAASARLLKLDSTGAIQRQIGAQGQGPGEFAAPAMIAVADTGAILVLDTAGWRLSRFDASGNFDTSWTLEIAAGIPAALESAGDGVLLQLNPYPIPLRGRPDVAAIKLVTLQPGASAQQVLWEFSGLGARLRPGANRSGPPRLAPMFSPTAVWARIPGDRVLVGRSDQYSLSILGFDGRELGKLARALEPRPVTEGFKESVRDALAAAGSRRLAETIDFAAHFPVVVRLLPGPDGTTIVVRGAGADDALGSDRDGGNEASAFFWDIFTAEGNYQGTIEPPEGFSPMATRGHLVAGIQADPVENVVRVLRFRID